MLCIGTVSGDQLAKQMIIICIERNEAENYVNIHNLTAHFVSFFSVLVPTSDVNLVLLAF